jgi:pilin isopeptide linkage protein
VVTDTGGQLQAVGTVTKDNNNASSIIFDNKYTHETVSINPLITKEITGDTPTENSTFIFLMKTVSTQAPLPTDEANGFITRTISGSGQEALGEITYTKPGTYVYEIWEDSSLQGKEYNKYTFDKTVYTMSVVVSDDGQGTLSAVVDYKDENENDKTELVFTNSYKKSHINITFHPSSKPNNGNSNGVNSGDTTNTNFLIYTMIAMTAIIIVLRKKKA